MQVSQVFSDPETVTDRQPYRLRIETKNGEVIEITEHDNGGFTIRGVSFLGARLAIWPEGANSVIIEVK